MSNDKIFTADYAYGAQETFRRALENLKYEEAHKILKNIPVGQNEHDESQRVLMVAEGLNALVYRLFGAIDKDNQEEKFALAQQKESYEKKIGELEKQLQLAKEKKGWFGFLRL